MRACATLTRTARSLFTPLLLRCSAGYYAIPVIEGLANAAREGTNPLEAVQLALSTDPAVTSRPADFINTVDKTLAPK